MDIAEALEVDLHALAGKVLLARPPMAWGSEAKFAELTDDFRLSDGDAAAGFEYVIGVDDIHDLLELGRAKRLSSRAMAELVVHYARCDALPAWLDDVPDRNMN